jgi:hypothetical protein
MKSSQATPRNAGHTTMNWGQSRLDSTPAQAAKWEGLVRTHMLAIDAQLAS